MLQYEDGSSHRALPQNEEGESSSITTRRVIASPFVSPLESPFAKLPPKNERDDGIDGVDGMEGGLEGGGLEGMEGIEAMDGALTDGRVDGTLTDGTLTDGMRAERLRLRLRFSLVKSATVAIFTLLVAVIALLFTPLTSVIILAILYPIASPLP